MPEGAIFVKVRASSGQLLLPSDSDRNTSSGWDCSKRSSPATLANENKEGGWGTRVLKRTPPTVRTSEMTQCVKAQV